MCEFHDSNGNGFGDIWWTDKLTYLSNIDVASHYQKEMDIICYVVATAVSNERDTIH